MSAMWLALFLQMFWQMPADTESCLDKFMNICGLKTGLQGFLWPAPGMARHRAMSSLSLLTEASNAVRNTPTQQWTKLLQPLLKVNLSSDRSLPLLVAYMWHKHLLSSFVKFRCGSPWGRQFRELNYWQLVAWQHFWQVLAECRHCVPVRQQISLFISYSHQAVPEVTWEATGFLREEKKSMQTWAWGHCGCYRQSPGDFGYTGVEGQHPHVMVSPCPQGCDVQTWEASSLHHKCKGVKWFAEGCAESLCQSLQSKVGSRPPTRGPCFATLKQIQIPHEDWTSALLRDQRAKLTLCWRHQLKQSLWCLRSGPCCPTPWCLPTWWVTMERKHLWRFTASKRCLLRQPSSNLLLCWLMQGA